MSLTIELEVKPEFTFQYKVLAKKVIDFILDDECFPYETEVSLTLTDDETIRIINKETRDIDRATDVLSFPMIDYEAPADYSILESSVYNYMNPDTDEIILGDIIISVDHLKAQAKEYGHSEKREYAFLITHSMLHLLGYDHIEKEERILMEKRQKEILESLNIPR